MTEASPIGTTGAKLGRGSALALIAEFLVCASHTRWAPIRVSGRVRSGRIKIQIRESLFFKDLDAIREFANLAGRVLVNESVTQNLARLVADLSRKLAMGQHPVKAEPRERWPSALRACRLTHSPVARLRRAPSLIRPSASWACPASPMAPALVGSGSPSRQLDTSEPSSPRRDGRLQKKFLRSRSGNSCVLPAEKAGSRVNRPRSIFLLCVQHPGRRSAASSRVLARLREFRNRRAVNWPATPSILAGLSIDSMKRPFLDGLSRHFETSCTPGRHRREFT